MLLQAFCERLAAVCGKRMVPTLVQPWPLRCNSMQSFLGPHSLRVYSRGVDSPMYSFIQPKGSRGRADDSYRVIWLPGAALEIKTKTASVVGTAGLAESKKGLGIRLEAGAFSSAWKRLKLDQPEPDANNPSMLFRLYPLPHGVDSTILREWASKQFNWSIKPLKAMDSGVRQCAGRVSDL